MKRIISMVMSILMIMTMFCGVLSVGSVAAETTCPVNINIVVGDVAEDGTFSVQFYLQDGAEYGMFWLDFDVKWDETKIAPVTKEITDPNIGETVSAFLSLKGANSFVGKTNAFKQNFYDAIQEAETAWTGEDPTIECYAYATAVAINVPLENETNSFYEAEPFNKVSLSTSTAVPFSANPTYLESLMEEGNAYLEEFGESAWTATKLGYNKKNSGVLLAAATFQKLDNAYGEANIWVETMNDGVILAESDGVTMDYYDTISYTGGVVDLGEAPAVETPALPDGMTITVDKTASVRTTNDYEGIRFTTSVTVTETAVWEQVAEMGTAIVLSGKTPGVDTTLTIPARVEYDGGKYIQERVDNADGTLTFTDGLLADAKAGKEIKFSGVISKVAKANYAQNFDAYAYVKLTDGTVVYSDNYHTSNMKTVCDNAMTDADLGNLTAEQAKVQALIDKYTAA